MPTISFDTIEHSDVTGLEVTRHDYVIDNHDPSNPTALHYIDGMWMDTCNGKYATELIDSLIHEKTKSPSKTKAKDRTEFPDDRPTNQRQGHLVGGDNGTKEGGVVENAMSGIDLTDQLRCFE